MSSKATSLLLVVLPEISNSVLSLRPNFNSGIPFNQHFMCRVPNTSDRITVPFYETSKFSFSITSRKTSFFA